MTKKIAEQLKQFPLDQEMDIKGKPSTLRQAVSRLRKDGYEYDLKIKEKAVTAKVTRVK